MIRSSKNQIDLSEIKSIIWRRKWLIILPMILVVCLTYAGSNLISPIYETSVIIWIGKSFNLSDGLQRLVGDNLGGMDGNYNQREELRSLENEIISTPYIHKLVDRLKLDKSAEIEVAAEKMQSKWPHLSKDQIKFTLLLEDLRKRIRIEFSGRDQVKITTESNDPYLTKDLSQTLGEIFIEEKRQQQMGAVQVSQNFSFEQVERFETDLQNKISARTAFEKEYLKIQLDELIISEGNRRDISSEIDATRLEIADREEEATQLLGKIKEIPSARITLNESDEYKQIKEEIRTHLESINNLMLKHRWNSSEVLNFRARLYGFVDQLESENERLVKAQFGEYSDETIKAITNLMFARAQLSMLYSKKNNMELAYADLRNKIGLIPEYQARLDQLDREVEAAREIRDRLRQQQESATISQAILSESDFKVIQPAQLPLVPIWPDNRKLILMGIVFGLILGGGIALLAELLDNSFRNVEDVEENLGLPVIGVIPVIDSVGRMKAGK